MFPKIVLLFKNLLPFAKPHNSSHPGNKIQQIYACFWPIEMYTFVLRPMLRICDRRIDNKTDRLCLTAKRRISYGANSNEIPRSVETVTESTNKKKADLSQNWHLMFCYQHSKSFELLIVKFQFLEVVWLLCMFMFQVTF